MLVRQEFGEHQNKFKHSLLAHGQILQMVDMQYHILLLLEPVVVVVEHFTAQQTVLVTAAAVVVPEE
jgi:hypothetical protein